MRCLITGHRLFKLKNYDVEWIQDSIDNVLYELRNPLDEVTPKYISYGLSGMASGVDLWFCESCLSLKIPYSACIPFDEQEDEVEDFEKPIRRKLIDHASKIEKIRNSIMVEKADMGLVVWDGNKGGTHNVVQQLVETEKPFVWVNPVSQKIWKCY